MLDIQSVLVAPKNQYNSFGKYKYRSLEDITEAVKPLLHKAGLVLFLADELVLIGDRYYVKATAIVTNGESTYQVSAYAREPLSRKGMDESQITGAASSYARKYAMNGLFAIDDTKDADSDDNSDAKTKPHPKKAPPKTTNAKDKKTDANPEPKINEIVELAFQEFKAFRKDALPAGFHYSLPIFYQVIEQKFGHLPDCSDEKLDKPKCVAHIVKQIGPREILEQDEVRG